MKSLKAKDLRTMSVEELDLMLAQHHADLYHNRRDLVFRKVTDTSAIKARRHDIARIKGVISEKHGGEPSVTQKKAPAKAAAVKTAPVKKAPVKKAAGKTAVAEKATAEKAPAKKTASKKSEVKA